MGIVGGLIKLNIKFYKNNFDKRVEIYNYIFQNIKKDLFKSKLPGKTHKDRISKIFYEVFNHYKNGRYATKYFEKQITKVK